METEEQQLEEVKRWWRENGRTVIVGIVLGLGGVSGWTAWNAHVDAKGEAVSALYERLVNTAALPNHAGAVSRADEILGEHPDSAYAGLAALVGAHSAHRSGDGETARRMLEWAIENAPQFEIRNVARIRLARVLSGLGEYDAALAALDQVDTDAFEPLVGEARGDVLAARGDEAGARAAYDALLDDAALGAEARERIRLKREALGAPAA